MIITLLAFLSSLFTAVIFLALFFVDRANTWRRVLHLFVYLAFFLCSIVYLGVLVGHLDGLTVGTLYLRPLFFALAGLVGGEGLALYALLKYTGDIHHAHRT